MWDAEEAFMEEDWLVAVLRHVARGRVHPFGVVWNIIFVEWPEVLFMCQKVDDFRRVRTLHVLLNHGDNVFDRSAVDDACEA